MMLNRLRSLAIVTLSALVIVSGGCVNVGLGEGTQRVTKFYILSSLSGEESGKEAISQGAQTAIGVGPITLPEYLNRPQIVTRVSAHEKHIAPFANWAESLEANFYRVLAENLSILLQTKRVARYPWRRSSPMDVQIAVDVTRFDAEPGGSAVLEARWTLRDAKSEDLLYVGQSNVRAPVDGRDYQAVVSAMSQTLSDFSGEIAAEIHRK